MVYQRPTDDSRERYLCAVRLLILVGYDYELTGEPQSGHLSADVSCTP